MAGTDHTQAPVEGGPSVILVRPQMGENIGAAARAMLNFGLTDLMLVDPRDGWPNEKARSMAAGADRVIEEASVFGTLEEAVSDFQHLYATTARHRDLVKPVMTPEAAAKDARNRLEAGERVGLLFGAEKAGLNNDHLALADTLVTIPVNPVFASLNLGQAVLLMGYEWFMSGDDTKPHKLDLHGTVPATKAEVVAFFEHLEWLLDENGFLYPPEKRPNMVRNLRNMWHRLAMTKQDVQTLRGILVALSGKRPGDKA